MPSKTVAQIIELMARNFIVSDLTKTWDLIGEGPLPLIIQERPVRDGLTAIWAHLRESHRIAEHGFNELLDEEGYLNVDYLLRHNLDVAEATHMLSCRFYARSVPSTSRPSRYRLGNRSLTGNSEGGIYLLKKGSPTAEWIYENYIARETLDNFRNHFWSKLLLDVPEPSLPVVEEF